MTENGFYVIYAPDGASARRPGGAARRRRQRDVGPARQSVDPGWRVLNISAQKAEISAGRVDVVAGIAKFTGRVECDTLKANAAIAQSYTPGAGNVW